MIIVQQKSLISNIAGLISRALPIYASSGTAANIVSAIYNNYYESTGTTGSVSGDISSLTAAQKANMMLTWVNDLNGTYDAGATPNRLIKDYTVQANAAAGGSLPGSGWVTLATVTGNVYKSRMHKLSFTGYNWWRIDVTGVGSGATTYAFKVSLHTNPSNANFGHAYFGDSIGSQCMDHTDPGTQTCDSFDNLVGGSYPPMINASNPGWTTDTLAPFASTWLAGLPIKYAWYALGVNDAQVQNDGHYETNAQAFINAAWALGITTVIPSITYAQDRDANVQTYLTAQNTVLAANPGKTIRGTDLYNLFKADPATLVSADHLHPTDIGRVAYRTAVASTASGFIQ